MAGAGRVRPDDEGKPLAGWAVYCGVNAVSMCPEPPFLSARCDTARRADAFNMANTLFLVENQYA